MSSSSVTEEIVRAGKLLVHIAENGHSFELNCDETTIVESVQRFIESVTGINFNDQLLLCSEIKLEPQRPLSAYKLPSDGREVFLFNKSRLQATSPPPSPENVQIPPISDHPPSPSTHDAHPLDDALDPALKALPSYERQFRQHYHKGHSIYTRTLSQFENCERLLKEQKVQERAVEVARANLNQYYQMMHQSYMDFMKFYSQQHRIHKDLLVNFWRDIEKLRSCKIHPALQTANRKCLLDFLKEDNLKKWVENCSNSHKQFESKVSQFQKMFSEVKGKVEDLFSSKANLPSRNLEITIKEHHGLINEQKSILQSLSKDVNTVKKLVDDCLAAQVSSSLRPHDAVSALGPMYDVHDKNHVPKMQACERSITKLLDICKDKKNEMNYFVHSYMQKITYISYFIKDTRLKFPVFREAMARQNELFSDLKLVRGIGPAYRACLAEIVRRKASMKLYMGMAGQLAEKLATKREVEVRRREEFLRAHSLFIPRDILSTMGLSDTPSQCDVNMAPFDTNLLDIDISDIDRFAPEHLTGLSFRDEKHGSSKGPFSGELEENASETTPEKSLSSLDFLEGSVLEIAGTSKLEVENAKLKADYASSIARICYFSSEAEYETLDDIKLDALLKDASKKTAEALHLKDEYGKYLESMLKVKHDQCKSYEKRIQELEQRLSDQYILKAEISSEGEAHKQDIATTEPMDEVSCMSNNSIDSKMRLLEGKISKSAHEGVDENMSDSSGMVNPQLDSSMMEPPGQGEKEERGKIEREMEMALIDSCSAESTIEPLSITTVPSSGEGIEPGFDSKPNNDNRVMELENALADKENQLNEIQIKLKAAVEDVAMVTRELEINQKLLDESQMNCAHLENCLHEAREEAQTHLCAADRRASEYSALRASAVKMRGIFERLRACIIAPGGVASFGDSLRSLAQSLSNSVSENEDESTAEFRQCIRVLADKVGFLLRHRAELLDKYPKAEAANEQLRKDLEEKKELVKTLYTKHQLEKQANKERISFVRLEVHEIAAFVLNSSSNYEAINRNSSSYFLSAESVALFTDHLPSRPSYIIGQIVHIERKTAKPVPTTRPELINRGGGDQIEHLTTDTTAKSGSYGVPIGCEYFVVTVAMLPDTSTIHSPSSS